MSKAKWIWFYGDFEIYHSMLLHSRRNDYEAEYPPFWHIAQPYSRVNFGTGFSNDKETTIKAISTGIGSVVIDNRRYPLNKDISVAPGSHQIFVQVMCLTGLPCIYIDSEYLKTDETWYANHAVGEYSRYTVNAIEIKENISTNGDLIYPIGLMTSDELVLAGAFSGLPNNNYYLYDPYKEGKLSWSWWTMSPILFKNNYAFLNYSFVATDSLRGHSSEEKDSIRPIINLKSNILVNSGNGTKENPYTLKMTN